MLMRPEELTRPELEQLPLRCIVALGHPAVRRVRRAKTMFVRTIIPLSLGLLCSCATQTRKLGDPVTPPGLPPEQVLGEKAGAKDPLILTLHLSDGQAVPCMVDTGTSFTTLDRSLKTFLGRRLRTERVQHPLSMFGVDRAGVYPAPKLYLGNVPLMTGPTVLAGRVIVTTNDHYKAILGMDCLRHYCIQVDFDEHKMRFLDPNILKRQELGLAFPLSGTTNIMAAPLVDIKWATNKTVRFMVDTGFQFEGTDFTLPPVLVRPAFLGHAALGTPTFISFTSGTANQVFLFPTIALGSETYQNVRVAEIAITEGPIDGWMALPFLARHKVTFDFPNQTMYLKLRCPKTGKAS